MQSWLRIKYAIEWGFFFGIISWLLSTGISSHIPTWGVWGIILSRTVMGFLSGAFIWKMPWLLRGVLISLAVNIPCGFVTMLLGVGLVTGFLSFVISGLIIGVLIEWILARQDLKTNHFNEVPN
ncbi:hypothetical protein DRQ07_00140 [candidate division KSB1 bacterium]|nr:MAG: hypothetical protein DRQ07_00140 [candidate division KSB1 bacterium]